MTCSINSLISQSRCGALANQRQLVTTQVFDSSPHVLDKSALYSGSRHFLLRAGQPAAAQPAAKNSCEPPKVVRSPEQLRQLSHVECGFIQHVLSAAASEDHGFDDTELLRHSV